MLSFRSIQAAPNSIIRLTPALFDIGHSSKLSSYQGPPTSLYSAWRVLTLPHPKFKPRESSAAEPGGCTCGDAYVKHPVEVPMWSLGNTGKEKPGVI